MKLKDFGVLFNLLGIFFIIEGLLMLSCIGFALYYKEDTIPVLTLCGSATTLTGLLFCIFFRKNTDLKNKKFSYLFVSIIWLVVSLCATLPYLLYGTFINFTDAFFESVSGFTTTGSSVLADIDGTPKSILFWRSITHWIGGMGVIMLVIAVIPFLGISSFSLYSAEVSGPSKEKLHPKMLKTAQILWNTYLIFTCIIILALLICGMNFFDAINHAFTVISTGGFSTNSSSVALYNSKIQYVLCIFMFIASINFSLIYFAMRGRFKKVFSNEELRFHIKVILISIALAIIFLKLSSSLDWREAIRFGVFQVATTLSSTGLVITDYTEWTPALTVLILLLMLYGGMAGSTAGGFKAIRLLVLIKNTQRTLKEIVHTRAVGPLKIDNKPIHENTLHSVMIFSLLYFGTFAIGTLLLILFKAPALEALGGAAASIGGTGAGLGKAGGFGSYLFYSTPSKWVCIILMFLGRLELVTIYILFFKSFWKK